MKSLAFSFENHNVRSVIIDNEPWFVAQDVCKALNLKDTNTSINKLDDDEKDTHLMRTLGGKQEMLIISESGLFTLILRCRDAVTKGTIPYRFRKWVTHEVLPSIRKTGGYLPKEQVVKGMLEHSRFILTFGKDMNILLEQVPFNYCTINSDNPKELLRLVNEWVPATLLPDMLKAGISRLAK